MLAATIGRELPGTTSADARARMQSLGARTPFVATAFHTALDMAGAHPLLCDHETRRVPILGLLQGDGDAELGENFDRLLADGYRTVKVKIGFDVDDDLRLLASIQRVVAGRAAVRVDANQGYTADEAVALIRRVDPTGIELFEQPCAAGDWQAHRVAAAAAAKRGLPLMLDESIYDIARHRARGRRACMCVHQGEADEIHRPRRAGRVDRAHPRDGHATGTRQWCCVRRLVLDGGLRRIGLDRQRG